MALEIGQQIGPYRITQQLGKGGMATVYKAYHEGLDRDVAIKVLHLAFKEDEGFLERFRREAQIIARLEHPNIVPVYDFSEVDEQPYLVLKYLEGQTLKQRIRQPQPVTLDEALHIVRAVASALDYAHVRSVLHRDVKPSNIIIDVSGQPYLTDFGLARIASLGESTLSRDMMLGTPQYISPEQAQGNRKLDSRTDIYSLGIVLYELVVGRVPFTGDTPYAIIHNHIYTPLPPPNEVNPTVPIGVQNVLIKALSKDPKDRYPTAGDMVNAFATAVQHENMTELSAASYRPEAFMEHARASIQRPLVQGSQFVGAPAVFPAEPGQGMWVSHTASQSSVKSKRQRFFSRNLWPVAGCLLFVASCVLAFAAFSNAAEIADSAAIAPVEAQSVFDGNRTSQPSAGLRELLASNLTEDSIRAYLQANPDSARAYFALALMQLDQGEADAARETIRETLDERSPSDLLIVEMADLLVSVMQKSENFAVRSVSSQTLYKLAAREDHRESVSLFCELARESDSEPYLEALVGQAMLTNFSRVEPPYLLLRNCETFDNYDVADLLALDDDDTIAEIDLIQANYYVRVEDTDAARTELEDILAEAEADATQVPDWVRDSAQQLLDSLDS